MKKKHSSRPVGGAETGSWTGRTRNKAVAGRPSEVADPVRWRTVERMRQARLQLADPTRWWLADPAAPHLHIDKPGGTAGEQGRPCNPGL